MRQDLPEEVLHARPGHGLSPRRGGGPPLLPGLAPAVPELRRRARTRADEVHDVASWLMDHARPGTPADQAGALARTVALACLGDRHLWEDLGLPDREALWTLMGEHFPALVRLNRGRMRWKKFIYRALCEREGVLICRSPSCSTCPEQAQCFAPELPGSAHPSGQHGQTGD